MNVHEERAKRWLCSVNHMTDEELSRTLQHGEIASLAAEFAAVDTEARVDEHEVGGRSDVVALYRSQRDTARADADRFLTQAYAAEGALASAHAEIENWKNRAFGLEENFSTAVSDAVDQQTEQLRTVLAKTQWWRLDAGYPSCGECHGFDPAHLSATSPEWRLARMGHRDECSVGALLNIKRRDHPIGFNQITSKENE